MGNPESSGDVMRASVGARRAQEVVQLVRKLRWMGEYEKAKELGEKLQPPSICDCVLASPNDTD
jgi:hypothetical protein